MALEDAGFDLIVEVGLGGGPEAFRSMALHTFPATRTAREIWSGPVVQGVADYEALPAYRSVKRTQGWTSAALPTGSPGAPEQWASPS